MCGRYALSLRPSVVRQRLADQDMYAEEAPPDDDDRIRQTYNFAPSYHGLIYRAARADNDDRDHGDAPAESDGEPARKRQKTTASVSKPALDGHATKETKYKLQAAKWGLVPFWTKRPPDYGSQMRTINCRDDSLIENRGMWNTMKQRKRCIVVAEGFYEWLKKNNGKEKIPHFTKRKDGELMCFAGLWDMVQYEGSEEKLYTYTIITTDSNAQLKFLHDRMPVIMEPGSAAMKMWLDPDNIGWSKDLQDLLKPYSGELECYPVDKGVGKVGNNSPSFVIPVDSKDNKKNIANFFANQAKKAKDPQEVTPKDQPDRQIDTPKKLTDAHEVSSKIKSASQNNSPENKKDTKDIATLFAKQTKKEEEKHIIKNESASPIIKAEDDEDDDVKSEMEHKSPTIEAEKSSEKKANVETRGNVATLASLPTATQGVINQQNSA